MESSSSTKDSKRWETFQDFVKAKLNQSEYAGRVSQAVVDRIVELMMTKKLKSLQQLADLLEEKPQSPTEDSTSSPEMLLLTAKCEGGAHSAKGAMVALSTNTKNEESKSSQKSQEFASAPETSASKFPQGRSLLNVSESERSQNPSTGNKCSLVEPQPKTSTSKRRSVQMSVIADHTDVIQDVTKTIDLKREIPAECSTNKMPLVNQSNSIADDALPSESTSVMHNISSPVVDENTGNNHSQRSDSIREVDHSKEFDSLIDDKHSSNSNSIIDTLHSTALYRKTKVNTDVSHPCTKPHKCPFCRRAFKWKRNMISHCKNDHNGLTVKSDSDSDESLTGGSKSMKDDLHSNNSNSVFQLPASRLKKRVGTEHIQTSTIASSDETRPHRCFFCSKTYIWKKDLVRHCTVKHNGLQNSIDKIQDNVLTEKIKCSNSSSGKKCKKSSGRNSIERNIPTKCVIVEEKSEQAYRCSICSKSFKWNHNRRAHMKACLKRHSRTPKKIRADSDDCGSKKDISETGCVIDDDSSLSKRGAFKTDTTTESNNSSQRKRVQIKPVIAKKSNGSSKTSRHSSRRNTLMRLAISTTNTGLVSSHTKRKSGSLKLTCPLCQEIFLNDRQFRIHIKQQCNKVTEMNSKKLYQCPQCEKSFAQRKNLKAHMLLHKSKGGECFISCHICSEKFPLASQLKSHMVTHYKNGRRNKLESYKRPSFVCSVCSKQCRDGPRLILHFMRHTGERPHKCPECGKAFAQKINMQTHMRTHSGEKPYKCTFCEAAFTQSGNLTNHLRRCH